MPGPGTALLGPRGAPSASGTGPPPTAPHSPVIVRRGTGVIVMEDQCQAYLGGARLGPARLGPSKPIAPQHRPPRDRRRTWSTCPAIAPLICVNQACSPPL